MLRKIEESLRVVSRHEREVLRLVAFEVFIMPDGPDELSLAVPLWPDADDWTPHIAALAEAFAARGKQPRLEFFQELHPRLPAALEAAGFACEMRAPVMALSVDGYPVPGESQVDVGYHRLDGEDEPLLRRYLQRQSVAFGGAEDESALGWLPTLRSGLNGGTVLGAALEREGQLLAGAVIQIGGGIGELAGVWTDPAWRQQGLAFALCRRLLGEYASEGYSLCWLSAAEGAQRLYEKLGFERIGTQLNYGRAVPSR
ncbi:MAG TPA: GNAT family N-acetyltransferase [Candidatus Sulfomarinibacteraceae bacterium]|nr:GNAT family N-acetyltransferase [Candidatus Sulfomarinibacteraceae bacterium]